MQTNTLWRLAAWLIAGAWSMASLGQSVAERPELRVGDRWVFHETGTDAGKEVDRRWSREIVDIASDGVIRVKRRDGNFISFDSSWNPRPADHPDISAHDFEFPLKVGAKWSYSSPPGERFRVQSFHEVMAYERIALPAGTYECFRLEGESRYDEKYYGETWYMTRWYCPAVKYLAKLHIVRNIRVIGGPPSRSVLDSELVQFVEVN